MSRDKSDFWVGLFVLLGFAALVFLALRAGNLSTFSFAPQYAVTANFNNVGGLKPGAPVKSAGVTVGRIGKIDFDNTTYEAVVTLDLNEGRTSPTDSSVSILTSGLLGEQYLGIDPGGEEENLKAGDKIQYTQSAVVLENLISQFLYSSADKQGTASEENVSGNGKAPAGDSPAVPSDTGASPTTTGGGQAPAETPAAVQPPK